MAEKLGYAIGKLMFLEKPGFSVHKANLSAIKAVAEMLGHDLTVIKTNSRPEDDENLVAYFRRRRNCRRAGLN